MLPQRAVTRKRTGSCKTFIPIFLNSIITITMSGETIVCVLEETLKEKIKKFKMRKEKNIAAIIMKIDSEKHLIIEDEELEDISIDELRDNLSEIHPSYTLLSYVYNHDDGRVSYPYCLIYITPQGGKPELLMMYAGSKTKLVKEAACTKVFTLRSVDELTVEWLEDQLKTFR